MDLSSTSGDPSRTSVDDLDLPQDPSNQKEQPWTTVTSKSGARSPTKTPPGSPSSNRRPLGPTWSPKYSNSSSAHTKPQAQMEDPSANNPPQWSQTSTISTTPSTTDPPSDPNKYFPFSP